MFTYVLLALVIYILYKFIFGFVLPIMSASRKLQQKMRDTQANAQAFAPGQENTSAGKPGFNSRNSTSSASSKDYIEFEEVWFTGLFLFTIFPFTFKRLIHIRFLAPVYGNGQYTESIYGPGWRILIKHPCNRTLVPQQRMSCSKSSWKQLCFLQALPGRDC